MTNDEIFLEFWRNYRWPNPPRQFWRLYHDEQGRPLEYSMEDRPGLYIDVTPEEYQRSDMRVRVRNGRIIHPPPPEPAKLTPSDSGTACDPSDVTIVVGVTQQHQKWNLRRNETC